MVSKRRPGPKQPKYAVPTEHWPLIMHRVVENNESLRQVADEYGVSHETIRRIMLHVQKQREQLEA
jgi:DNA-directed RNA polymerase subunit N (RpoN/RPB10)